MSEQDTPTSTPVYTSPLSFLHLTKSYHHFKLTSMQAVQEIDGYAYIFEHEQTHARLMWLACADTNKTFSIAFKTPPTNSTGVFHILEHAVLCGSARYPVKEPFVHLLKTSMQTFLNAMTFPDKTVYPVSSTNQKDLINLTNIYLDAVLHPNIYTKPDIFKQEGWHLELNDDADNLCYNGVVLNEMRGSLSSPETMLYHKTMETLFCDTCYGYVSGGDVREIPNLTYEEFIDAHKRHYQLANSYTILYGDLCLDDMLQVIDKHFSNAPAPMGVPNELRLQRPHSPKPVQFTMKTTPDNAMVQVSYVIDAPITHEEVLAASVIIESLCATNDSPLKRDVLEANLGNDMSAMLVDECAQPVIMFQLKGAHKGVATQFKACIEERCAQYVRDGIDRKRINATLAQTEFMLRERDWSTYSDGVALAIQVLSSWLYNDEQPLDTLKFEAALAHMKRELTSSYFEHILQKFVCKNAFCACVELIPSEQDDYDEARLLAAKKAQMTTDELEAIRTQTTRLKALQEAPDSPQNVATLPRLHTSDITASPALPQTSVHAGANGRYTLLHHAIATRGITYMYSYFPLDTIRFSDAPYVGVLQEIFGKVSTTQHSADELDILTQQHLGALSAYIVCTSNDENPQAIAPYFAVSASALAQMRHYIVDYLVEICASSRFDELERIHTLLMQRKLSLESAFINAGHSCAMDYLSSMRFAQGRLMDEIEGVSHYRFLTKLLDRWDEEKLTLPEKLAAIARVVFLGEAPQGALRLPFVVSVAGSTHDAAAITAQLDDAPLGAGMTGAAAGVAGAGAATANAGTSRLVIPTLKPRRCAFIIPSQVQFIAADAPTLCPDINTIGTWNIASRALSLDYLWNEVRVKNGAYGCAFQHNTAGFSAMWSYRDPAIATTLEAYKKAAAWLQNWHPTCDDFEGYVVSTTAMIDAPQKPYAQARMLDMWYLKNRPKNFNELIRTQQLHATPADVRSLAQYLEGDIRERCVCVFGAQEAIQKAGDLFDTVDVLIAQA